MSDRLTLPRGSRITRSLEVRRAFDRGRSSASGPVVVYAFGRDDDLPPRYALVVSRRWGGAVQRNRVRRLLREAFRTARPELPRGLDFVLLPRGDLLPMGMTEVRHRLVQAAHRAAARFRAEGEATPPPPGERRR